MNPIHVSLGEGKAITVAGSKLTIRIHGRDTAGVISVAEAIDNPGEGPPPHIHHREDETFQILDGEYEFTCGGKTLIAKKGATVFAPRGVPHSYRNIGSAPGLLMVSMTPAGFETFFEKVGALSAAEQTPARLMEMGKNYRLEFLPPPNPPSS